MSYIYNEDTKEVTKVYPPKITGEDAIKLMQMKPNKVFLNKIKAMNLNVEK